jgi:adenylate kinase family enzyme
VVNYYRGRGVLVEVNGEQSIEEVARALVEALKKRLTPESPAAA